MTECSLSSRTIDLSQWYLNRTTFLKSILSVYLLKTHLNDYNVWVRGINLDPVKKGYLQYDFLLRTEIFSKLNLVI